MKIWKKKKRDIFLQERIEMNRWKKRGKQELINIFEQ